MKKIALLVVAALIAAIPLTAGVAVEKEAYAAGETLTLKVANWEDYIDESVLEEFETQMSEKYGKTVTVQYNTFGTNENLYNDLKIANGYLYDVICPSDYMIEKMAKEGMLKELSLASGGNYDLYASDYIKGISENKIKWNDKTLADYAVCYMWGTMGYVYNPKNVSHEDMKTGLPFGTQSIKAAPR